MNAKTLYWLIRREFWEHRGGFIWAPAVTGGIFLLMTILAIVTGEVLGRHTWNGINWDASHHIGPDDMKKFGMFLDGMMGVSAIAVIGVMAIVVFFYCLGSLYDDRKDKSILFWQSLPIANWKTVASKVVSAALIAPAIAATVGVIAGLVMILLTACVASIHGINVWAALSTAHPFKLILNVIGLIPLYALCALPTIGWLMLCSAWARSKPFLWAFIIPLAGTFAVWWLHLIGIFDLNAAWVFWHIATRMLFAVGPGNWMAFVDPVRTGSQDEIFEHLSLLHNYSALGSIELWLGVVAGTAMLGGAIWLRRWRDDS